MSPDDSGWYVFDGDSTMVDGPFDGMEEAEAAAFDLRSRQEDPEEHFSTHTAHVDPCVCPDSCWSCDHGLIVTEQQAWVSNWDDQQAAAKVAA